MIRVKLLGPVKKCLSDYKTQNYFDLNIEEYGLTINQIFKNRNVEITKYYSLYVGDKQVDLEYVLKDEEVLMVVPILVGG